MSKYVIQNEKDKMKIAAIILNYNDWKRCVELANLIVTYSALDEVIIIDNRSSDDSLIELKRCCLSKVHLVCTEKNGGYGYGNNFGMKYASEQLGCTHALICNPDVAFSKECVLAMRETFEINIDSRLAVVAPVLYEKKEMIQAFKIRNIREEILESSIVYVHLFGRKGYSREYFEQHQECLVDVIPGSLLMVDILKMSEMGVYDEKVFLYQEEHILGYQCKKYGYEICLLTTETFKHYHHTPLDAEVKQKKRMLESKMYYLENYMHISSAYKCFAKIYFAYCMLEIRMVCILKRMKLNFCRNL